MSTRVVTALALFSALAGCVGGPGADDPPRGPIGKADLVGSCAESDCAGRAPTGNCWCDDECTAIGDCCADRGPACGGGMTFATYNLGLAHGAVPYAKERLQPLVAALAKSEPDVLCLQEVWTDADAEAIERGVAAAYPYAFRAVTENDASSWLACGPTQWIDLYQLNGCVSDKCTPGGVSIFECVKNQCAAEYADITDPCKLCLAANATSPLSCAAWRAPMFANEGRNGLLLLSRQPIEAPSYTPFETYVIKRGVIRADVGGFQVQCTHMSPDLESVPYPKEGSYASWLEEHLAQIGVMAAQAADRCTVLLGDLNAGPATAGVSGELADNFQSLLDAGYVDDWTENQVCTHCATNPLVCSRPDQCGGHSSRIDHILFHGCPAGTGAAYRRIADEPIDLVDEQGVTRESRLSDHYGVSATLE